MCSLPALHQPAELHMIYLWLPQLPSRGKGGLPNPLVFGKSRKGRWVQPIQGNLLLVP